MIKAIIRIIRLHSEALSGKVSVENTKNTRIVGKVFREKEREKDTSILHNYHYMDTCSLSRVIGVAASLVCEKHLKNLGRWPMDAAQNRRGAETRMGPTEVETLRVSVYVCIHIYVCVWMCVPSTSAIK